MAFDQGIKTAPSTFKQSQPQPNPMKASIVSQSFPRQAVVATKLFPT